MDFVLFFSSCVGTGVQLKVVACSTAVHTTHGHFKVNTSSELLITSYFEGSYIPNDLGHEWLLIGVPNEKTFPVSCVLCQSYRKR